MRTCGAKHEGDNNSSEKHSRSQGAGMNSGVETYDENFIMKAYLNNYLYNEFEYIPKDYSTSLSKIQELVAKKVNLNLSFLKY